MDSLRIKNLRSLSDTGTLKFGRINVLVGQNSSGKSTFVRAFPLIKQSVQVRTTSGILWFGPFVDFGSFEEAVSRDAVNEPISIELAFRAPFRRIRFRPKSGMTKFPLRSAIPMHLRVSIRPDPQNNGKHLSGYDFRVFDQKLSLSINQDLKVCSFRVNGIDFTEAGAEEYAFFRQFNLLPGVTLKSDFELEESYFDLKLCEVMREYVHGKKDSSAIYASLRDLNIGSPSVVLEQLKRLNLGTFWADRVNRWTKESAPLKSIVTLLFAREFYKLMEAAGDYISVIAERIHYVTPLRATAERYYRTQGLAVDEIDPQGRNVAMFLSNLADEEANEFADWTAKHMGFEVRAMARQGHISVVISDPGSSETTNLADTGFGFSQVLPILAQLWQASRTRTSANAPHYFAIEQPELHLHPRMQAKLADLLISITKDTDSFPSNLRIVLETHSETLINRFGRAIDRKIYSQEDVRIYLFDKVGVSGKTTVGESKYDSDGYLEDWPYGFFDPVE